MLITQKNYNEQMAIQSEKNKILSQKLIELFQDCSLKDMHIASVGNSIASGYSKCDEMLPLLARSDIYKSGAPISFYSFARVRKNEELNVIKWYQKNISHDEINTLLVSDILAKADKYAFFSSEQLEAYKKMSTRSNIGLNDFVKLDNNIMIYSGLSGTFTDRMRRGDFFEKAKCLSSFKEDFENLKKLLLQIYIDNPNIQIYVCGLPNFMGVGISNVYDMYIREAIKIVPNAIYVKGSNRNLLSINSNQKEFDIHYNRVEYLQLLNRIFEEIFQQYIPMLIKNKVLEELSNLSFKMELLDTKSIISFDVINNIIKTIFEEYGHLIEKYNISNDDIIEYIWKYYDKYHLMNYGCTKKEDVKSVLNLIKSQ